MTTLVYVQSAGKMLAIDPGEYHCEFVVYECVGETLGGDPILQADDSEIGQSCETIDKAQKYMHGYVKWDGCINWDMDSDGCMKHNCGMADALSIADIFRAIYVAASSICDNWDGITAGTESR